MLCPPVVPGDINRNESKKWMGQAVNLTLLTDTSNGRPACPLKRGLKQRSTVDEARGPSEYTT